ncbi:MAG: hypothetical protein ACKOEC_02040 [Acidimicrobiia bacterium]
MTTVAQATGPLIALMAMPNNVTQVIRPATTATPPKIAERANDAAAFLASQRTVA